MLFLANGPTGADRAVGPMGRSELSHIPIRDAIDPRFRFEAGGAGFIGPNDLLAKGRMSRRSANGRAGRLANGTTENADHPLREPHEVRDASDSGAFP